MEKRVLGRLTLVLVGVVFMLSAASAIAETVKLEPTSNDGILIFESKDGMFKWWVDTRVYIDASFYMDDDAEYTMNIDDEDVAVHMGSGVQIRRARMAWKAILWEDWYAEVDVDFAEESTALKDAYVRYHNLFDRQGYVRVGNFRTRSCLDAASERRWPTGPTCSASPAVSSGPMSRISRRTRKSSSRTAMRT